MQFKKFMEKLSEGAYEKSEENKRSADAAKKQGDMFAHHMHMADHHDNLAQWHGEKGRHGEADKHAEKAEQHHEKAMALKEEVELDEEHLVHVDDGSKYGDKPNKKDAAHVMAGVTKHNGKFDGHSDKGAYFKFNSKSDAEGFVRHVKSAPHRTVYADLHEEVELEESMTDSWKKVQSMDKGSVTGGKEGVRKRLDYLNAVHAHHKKYGNDTLKVRKEIENLNRSRLAEADTETRSDYKLDKAGRKSHKQIVFHDGTQNKELDDKLKREETEMQEEMTDAQKQERERLVKGMKKNIASFKSKYGTRAKEVMYATATKNAMKEDAVLDEKSEQARKNKTMKNMMDASRGARWKVQNKMTGDDVRDWDGKHKTAQAQNKAIGRALRNEDLDEAVKTITLVGTSKHIRPGQEDKHEVVKHHGKSSDGSDVYTVKQPNGFHGVLAIHHDKKVVTGSTQNNHDEATTKKIADHYVKHGQVGLKQGWHAGSSMYKLKESIDEEQAKKQNPPFDPPYKTATSNIKDKSGAVHTPMSRARDLARQAMKKQMKEAFDLDITDEQADSLVEAANPEQLDELSKGTIGSYIKKAKGSAIGAAQVTGMGSSMTGQKTQDKAERKVQKRAAGINKAVDRLTKEDLEVDILDEAVESGNKGRGYHGEHPSETADAAYSKAHGMVKKVAGESGHLRDAKKPNVMVKHYLDSQHGRHLKGNENAEYIKKDFGKFKKSYKPEMHEGVDFDEEGNLMSEKLKFSDFIAKMNEQLLEYESDTGGVYRHTKKATYGTSYQGDDEDDKPKKADPDAPKRGRGRPAGSKSGANQKVSSGKSYGGIAVHSLNLPK